MGQASSECALRKLPKELRAQIFYDSFQQVFEDQIAAHFVNHGSDLPMRQLPSFISALRETPDLYEEAIIEFYKACWFALNHKTYHAFAQLKPGISPLIRVLAIELKEKQPIAYPFLKLFLNPNSNLHLCSGVQHLKLHIKAGTPLFYCIIGNGLKHWKMLRVLDLFNTEEKDEMMIRDKQEMIDCFTKFFKGQEKTKHWEMVGEPRLRKGSILHRVWKAPVRTKMTVLKLKRKTTRG